MPVGAWRAWAGMADDAALAGVRMINANPNSATMLGNPIRPGNAAPGKPGARSGQGPNGVGTTDADDFAQFVNMAESASNKAMMGSFIGMGAVSAGAGLSRWTGKKTGLTSLRKFGDKMELVSNAKFSDVGGIPIISDIGRFIGSATQSVATMGARVLEATGIADWRANANGAKYAKHQAALEQHAGKLFAAEFTHPEVHAKMMALKSVVDVAPKDFDHAAFAEAATAAKEAGRNVKGLHGHIAKLEKQVAKAHGSYGLAEGWANLSKHAGKTAENLKGVGISHGVMNGAILTGVAISDYRTGHDLHKSLKELRQLYADMTHQKPEDVSGTRLMFGSVPKVVAQARGQLLREFGPSVVMDAANTVLNIHFVAHSKGGSLFLLIAAGMGSQLIRGVLAGNILPTYAALRDAQNAGAPLGGEEYAKLIGEASRELKERGGAESNFAKVLGEVYAAEKLKVSEVLREVENGKMHQRLEELKAAAIKDHDEKVKAAAERAKTDPKQAPHEQHAHKHEAHTGDKHMQHVDRLHHKQKPEHREVLGKHTEKLHKAAHDVASSVGLGGVV